MLVHAISPLDDPSGLTEATFRPTWSLALTATTARKLPQFRLSTLMSAVLVIAVACALLRVFWGEWPVAIVAAWGILLLIVPLLLTRPWIMLAVFLAVFAGLLYSTEGEWWPLVIVMPTGLLGIVLLKLIMFDSTVLPAVPDEGDEIADCSAS